MTKILKTSVCKKRYNFKIRTTISLILTVILFCSFFINEKHNYNYCCVNTFAAEDNKTIDESSLYAKSALLMDGESKRVLYEKNGYERLPMASTTKIMTCLVALENSKPGDVVEFSNYAASMPKVKLGANSGRKFYMKDLLYSLMLESHNDTAVAIAEKVGGDVTGFANMMNERAARIGVKNTNFVTPNGLDDPMHYTTAYDLALIASEAVKNEEFLKIINTNSYSFNDLEEKCNFCVNNKDAFLLQMEGAIGIKTGFTGNAGYCFVGAVKKNNKLLISVVLASGWPPNKSYKWSDTKKLMNFGLDNYNYCVIFDNVDFYKSIEITNGKKDKIDTYIIGHISTLLSKEDKVEYMYDIPDKISAPIKKDGIVGYVKIVINNEEYAKLKIFSKYSVKEVDYCFKFKQIIDRFRLDFF